jgi:hypothetical protein
MGRFTTFCMINFCISQLKFLKLTFFLLVLRAWKHVFVWIWCQSQREQQHFIQFQSCCARKFFEGIAHEAMRVMRERSAPRAVSVFGPQSASLFWRADRARRWPATLGPSQSWLLRLRLLVKLELFVIQIGASLWRRATQFGVTSLRVN